MGSSSWWSVYDARGAPSAFFSWIPAVFVVSACCHLRSAWNADNGCNRPGISLTAGRDHMRRNNGHRALHGHMTHDTTVSELRRAVTGQRGCHIREILLR